MNVQRQIDRLIAYQAAEWYENLKNREPVRHADFVRWISESPRHMEAFLAISSEAPVVRKVLSSGAFELTSLLQEVSGGEKVLPLRMPERRTSTAPRKKRRPRLAMWLAAAMIAVLAIAIPLQLYFLDWQQYETPIGEQRTIQLAEGSIVNLNALSRVEVRFSDEEREVRLEQGEATFNVSHDPLRPFRVRTPGAVVEAVGTQFNVYVRPDGSTKVSVLEGKVTVTEAGSGIRYLTAKPATPVPVAAGQEAQVESLGRISLLQDPNVEEAVAWQQRKLTFKRTALEHIAAEFNRYNQSVQIRLEGIDPGTFRFSGAFDADDPESLATLLEREPDLVVEREGGEIVIRKR